MSDSVLVTRVYANGDRILWDGDKLFEVHVDELPPEPEEGSDKS